MSSDDGRLSRWSRRKADARARRGGAAPELESEPKETLPVEAEPRADSETPPPDLPDIESLTAESDFSQFMREGVPNELRKLALRKLWTSDPALTELDDLLEYGEDFTDGGALIAKVKDVWDEARGDPKDRTTRPEAAQPEPAEPAQEASEEPADSADEDRDEADDAESGDAESIS